MAKKPQFFKVLLGGFSTQLRIPPAFLKHISETSSEKIILVGPSGGHWHVKINKRNSIDMYLEDGWQEFVKDHSIEEADFLLFGYNGNLQFNVQIFDRTACERKDAFSVKPSQEFGSCKEKKKWFRSQKNYFSLHSPSKSCPKSNTEMHSSDTSIHGSELDEAVKIEEEAVDLASSELDSHTKKFHFSSRRHSARKGISENPYFRIRITEYQVSKGLFIIVPKEFWKAYMPNRSINIVLWNSRGKSCTVKYIVTKYSGIFSAGWSSFVRANNVKAGDACIFELVDDLVMQVACHICILQGNGIYKTSICTE